MKTDQSSSLKKNYPTTWQIFFNSYTIYILQASIMGGKGEKRSCDTWDHNVAIGAVLNDVNVIFSTWKLIPVYIHSEAIVAPP